jgi:hypothetical protein
MHCVRTLAVGPSPASERYSLILRGWLLSVLGVVRRKKLEIL